MGSYAWAAPYLDLLYEAGVITGTGGQRYRPADAVSRGDFMLMLYRAFQLTPASGAGFPDVPPGSYYAQAIQAARAAGIASGYPDGGFHPQEPVTRQDAMVLLERTMQATGWSLGAANTGYLSGFRDGGMVALCAGGHVPYDRVWYHHRYAGTKTESHTVDFTGGNGGYARACNHFLKEFKGPPAIVETLWPGGLLRFMD